MILKKFYFVERYVKFCKKKLIKKQWEIFNTKLKVDMLKINILGFQWILILTKLARCSTSVHSYLLLDELRTVKEDL